MQARAHDFVGIEVRNQAQVTPAAEQVHVRGVADPDLFRPAHGQVLDEVAAPKQRQAGLGRDDAPLAAANQQAVAGQQGKEVIAAHPQRVFGQVRQQQKI